MRIECAYERSTPPPVPHSILLVYSWLQRLRSLRHRFWYGVSERVRWSRGVFHETPARELPDLSLDQADRIAALRTRYQVQFEAGMSAETAVNNYEYLDILDRAWGAARLPRPRGGRLSDIGCASFWYAAALNAFFRPDRLVGVEVEGYRLFRDGHTRIDYARGYLAAFTDARFVVADYRDLDLPAEIITAWFPFVTPAAILAWRLPLSLLAPEGFFGRVRRNLRPDGWFVLVNHGAHEAAVAQKLCEATGLRCRFGFAEPGILSAHRHRPAVVSIWQRL
jgi:SAM-dependent methyltransferase